MNPKLLFRSFSTEKRGTDVLRTFLFQEVMAEIIIVMKDLQKQIDVLKGLTQEN
jgi:hypothetical protein